ncbi:MAG: class II glutamine amidotransferase [Coriobacteriales bacterium]
MCELFGYCGAQEAELSAPLAEFFSHSEEHPDGWGLAVGGDGFLNIEKEPGQALQSSYLRNRLGAGVQAKLALGHIRFATAGSLERGNCHPFTACDATGRQWTLVHNGTILDFPQLEAFRQQQAGSTDSERFLLCLVQRVDARSAALQRPLSAQERCELLDELVAEVSSTANKLNILVYDGELLYAHCNCAGSLHICRLGDAVLVSTKPLSAGSWEEAPLATLGAFKEGRLFYCGNSHGRLCQQDEGALRRMRSMIVAKAA